MLIIEVDMNEHYLMAAIIDNKCATALDLIRRGADVNLLDEDQCTGLEFAAKSGNLNLVKALLDAGAVIDSRDRGGRTPLMWAASRGNKEVLELLIERGADVNARDTRNRTALFCNVGDRLDILEYLIKSGADALAKSSEGKTAAEEALLNAEYDLRPGVIPNTKGAARWEAIAAFLKKYEGES